MIDLTGKKALVTGAASGIGRATALTLSEAGAFVLGCDIDAEGGKTLAAELGKMAGGGSFVQLDVTDPPAILACCDEVTEEHGAMDILVNVAGWDRTQPFVENSPEFIEKIVQLNYLGQVRICQAFVKPIIEGGKGAKIVNVSSDAGRVGSMGETVYAGAKGGVIAFSKSLAREMARHNVCVNVVAPGPTDTPLFQGQSERIKEALLRAIPFRRLAQPQDVANGILYFASDRAGYVTGQVLSVSGGLTMVG
jgi:2-hydroxycyclohexanecarboxyl-CoA dehydrogenase